MRAYKYHLRLLLFISASAYLCTSCNQNKKNEPVSANVSLKESPTSIDVKNTLDITKNAFTALSPAALKIYKGSSGSNNTGSGCESILINGVMDTYNLKSYKEYKKALRDILSTDYEETKKNKRDIKTSANFPIPMSGGVFDFSGKGDYSDDDYKNIVNKYKSDKSLDIEEKDLLIFSKKIANKDIVNAWSKCMVGGEEFNYTILGDEFSEFLVNLNIIPQSVNPNNSTTIITVTLTNLKLAGDMNLIKGKKIPFYSGLSQKLMRIDSTKPAAIVVNVKNYKPLTIQLNAYKKLKEKAIMESQWVNMDEHGNKYYEIFSAPMPQCYDCRHKPGIPVTANFILSDEEGKIDSLGVWPGCCGVTAFVHDIEIKKIDDRSFRITAISQGPPCIVQFAAYYKKPKQVCVKNCE